MGDMESRRSASRLMLSSIPSEEPSTKHRRDTPLFFSPVILALSFSLLMVVPSMHRATV